MKRIVISFFIAVFCFGISSTSTTHATTEFDTSVTSSYLARQDGSTIVTQTIELKNNTEYYYTPSYTLSTGLQDVKNIAVYNAAGAIPFEEIDNKEAGKSIKIQFQDRVVGLGKVNYFTITFSTNSIAKKMGDVWEVSIPGLDNPDSFAAYQITVQVPQDFGNVTIIKPQKTVAEGSRTFSFTKDEITKSGVMLIFGKNQYYRLNLAYHLSNKNLFPIKTEIALPASTNYQEVLIESIKEKPMNTYRDDDGNWLALYSLNPQEEKTIHVTAFVKIAPTPEQQGLSDEQKKLYTQELSYWDTNAKIKEAAKKMHSAKDVYEYVTKSLTYNYERFSEKSVRLGAKKTIESPENSVCLEFTDLFISVARAAGIPARAVEGYAYTQNTKLRPLSLVKDVLHAWPEYYDEEKKTWVMVDPTWGNTTGGIDYFSTLDFAHIAFITKGKDSTYPVPAGGYKVSDTSQDVVVNVITAEEFEKKSKSSFSVDFDSQAIAGFSIKGMLTIKNTGSTPLKDKYIQIDSTLTPSHQEYYITDIPPFGEKTILVSFDKTPFLTNKTYKITIHFDGKSIEKSIAVSILPNPLWILIGGGIFASCFIISIIAYRSWRIFIQRPKPKNTVRRKSKRS